jgi:alcohol dehydrogenase class IV
LWWFISPKIIFGEDALEQLRSVEGKRVLVVTDQVLAKLGMLELVLKELKYEERSLAVFDQVEAEPSFENVEKIAELARSFQPDLIVSLGGGSCIDAGKAAWILYERPDLKLEEVSPLTPLGLRKKARLVAIPTTAGTGSDSTWVAVLTDNAQKLKVDYIASRELTPDFSILDPRFIVNLPSQSTAYTGLDALTQGIEAYVSQWQNDFTDGLAIRCVQLVFEYLPKAFDKPADLLARQKTQNAATMSGLAFGNAQVGLAHAMGHSLGAVLHMPHGLAVALSNLYVIPFSQPSAPERYREIAHAIGIEETSAEQATTRLVKSIKDLMTQLKVPLCLREAGISRDLFDQNIDSLVEKTNASTCTFVNPRVPNLEEIRKLFACMYEGREVDF